MFINSNKLLEIITLVQFTYIYIYIYVSKGQTSEQVVYS